MSDAKVSEQKILIVGCGDLGIATAKSLQSQGYHVTGARRSVNKLPDDLPGIAIDVTKPESLTALGQSPWHAVIVTLTADSFSADAYQTIYVDGLKNILTALEAKAAVDTTAAELPLILFASSTSVYGQNDGSIVDEDSPTEPQTFSGQAMLRAEALMADYSGLAISIRFGGIYGRTPGRLLQRLRDGFICPREPVVYSNRIHFVDCCAVFTHFIHALSDDANQAITITPEPIYLAVDSKPTALREVMEWIAIRSGIDPDSLLCSDAPIRGGNKRVNNAKLLNRGFQLQYTDYQAGFAELLS